MLNPNQTISFAALLIFPSEFLQSLYNSRVENRNRHSAKQPPLKVKDPRLRYQQYTIHIHIAHPNTAWVILSVVNLKRYDSSSWYTPISMCGSKSMFSSKRGLYCHTAELWSRALKIES